MAKQQKALVTYLTTINALQVGVRSIPKKSNQFKLEDKDCLKLCIIGMASVMEAYFWHLLVDEKIFAHTHNNRQERRGDFLTLGSLWAKIQSHELMVQSNLAAICSNFQKYVVNRRNDVVHNWGRSKAGESEVLQTFQACRNIMVVFHSKIKNLPAYGPD